MCINNGRLIAVPYNSATILEIGERVCMPSDAKDEAASTLLEPPPTMSESISSMLMPVPMAAASGPTQTFILALPGCPDGNNGARAHATRPACCRPRGGRECILPHARTTTRASQKRASTTVAARGTP